MQDILMLDLEGTLTSGISRKLEYTVRPYASKFLQECAGLFDIIYLNTSVLKEPAEQVMSWSFPSCNYQYWDWRGFGEPYKKTRGFEQLKGNRIVMVDDCVSEEVLQDISLLRVKYVKIKGWGCGDTKPKDSEMNDRELIGVLNEIKQFLGK